MRDPALSLDDRLAEINRRADLGDTRTLAALDQVGSWVGIGAAILTNALNPGAIVLSGYFAEVGHRMRPAIEEQLLAGVLAPQAGGTRVELSTLGFTAAVRGGAAVALEAVFDDPTLVAPPRAALSWEESDDRRRRGPLLQMTGIVKEFPGVRALDGVDLDVRAGEVHCLLGQNGAGKSTLIKVLSGFHQPDDGTITWDGEETSFSTPAKAIEHGVATIYQELDLVPHLDVTENVFLGHEVSRAGFTQRGQAHQQVRDLLARLGHSEISPTKIVGELSPASQQIVSMARALSHDTRLLVLDEPSAVLDQEEVKNLFRVIRDLTAEGVAVVYISHRLEEIREIGDRITVLKDGRTVATGLAVADTPTAELIKLMTGRSIEYVFPPRPETAPRPRRAGARGAGPQPRRRVHGSRPHRARRRDRRPRRPGRRRPLRDRRDGVRRPPAPRPAPSPSTASGCGAARSRTRSAPGWAWRPRSARARGCCSTRRSSGTSPSPR